MLSNYITILQLSTLKAVFIWVVEVMGWGYKLYLVCRETTLRG